MKFFLLLVFFYLLKIIFKNLFIKGAEKEDKKSNVIDAEFEEIE